MFRFDHMIRTSMTVREIRSLHPETAEVFERLGFRDVCDDCSLETVARRQGISPYDVLDALRLAISNGDAIDERHA